MEHPYVSNMKEANLQRTRYLLSHYHRFIAQSPPSIDIQVSKAVLDILSHHFLYRDIFTQDDRDLIDHCGALLIPAIDQILMEIKSYPYEIVSTLYPVLYHNYFSPDGHAIDLIQLNQRLHEENLFLEEEALQSWLDRGEIMFAALLFSNRLLTAIANWN